MSSAAEIEAQAALWIARCDAIGFGDPDFIAWLSADPRHRATYLKLSDAWRRSERLERLRPIDGPVDPDLLAPPAGGLRADSSRGSTRPRKPDVRGVAGRPRSRALGWAAAAASFVAIVGMLWWGLLSPTTRTYQTGPEGLSRILLSDGSEITLNSNTEVQVHFTALRRSLILTRGEAQFTVTHDVHRPFEVEAGTRVVIAVGTAFDVRLDDSHTVEVTVTEGRVAIMGAGQAEPKLATIALPIVLAGESAFATPARVAIRHTLPAQISSRLAWERRELLFQGESLSEAVAEFNRYNGHRLVIEDPSIDSLQIGGKFEALDVASFTAALERSFAISARVAGDGTIHLFRTEPEREPPDEPR